MPAVLDQLKNVAYTSAGVNLLVTDALLGREVSTPDAFGDHPATARQQATDALVDLKDRVDPVAEKLADRLPNKAGEALTSTRAAMWDFINVEPTTAAKKTTAKTKTKTKTKTKKA